MSCRAKVSHRAPEMITNKRQTHTCTEITLKIYSGCVFMHARRWLYLDLLNAVDNEHVLQVLHGSVHPVVEGRRPLGKLQVQLVNSLPQLLHTLQTQRVKTQHWFVTKIREDETVTYLLFTLSPDFISKWDSVMCSGRTSSESLLFWVRVPRLSHWSQMPWQRLLTVAASW